jgi:hypothetical protein
MARRSKRLLKEPRELVKLSKDFVVTRLGALVQIIFYGEFDPGSGRTLAACLIHASRARTFLRECLSGGRVSNAWAICPLAWDNSSKGLLTPDNVI